jgi:hypothetical protein
MEPHREHQVSDCDAKRPIIMSEVCARQGVTGHNIRYVLGFGRPGTTIALTVRIIELAQRGERDSIRLCDDALAYLREQSADGRRVGSAR